MFKFFNLPIEIQDCIWLYLDYNMLESFRKYQTDYVKNKTRYKSLLMAKQNNNLPNIIWLKSRLKTCLPVNENIVKAIMNHSLESIKLFKIDDLPKNVVNMCVNYKKFLYKFKCYFGQIKNLIEFNDTKQDFDNIIKYLTDKRFKHDKSNKCGCERCVILNKNYYDDDYWYEYKSKKCRCERCILNICDSIDSAFDLDSYEWPTLAESFRLYEEDDYEHNEESIYLITHGCYIPNEQYFHDSYFMCIKNSEWVFRNRFQENIKHSTDTGCYCFV